MNKHYWLSFCDGDKPKGQQFLGVVLVDAAESLLDAVSQTWTAKVNPGGEVASFSFTDEQAPVEWLTAYKAAPKMTLLSRVDLEAHGLEVGSLAELEAEAKP